MERLKELVRTGRIHAIFMQHPDRMPDEPAHRMMFRLECQDNRVLRCDCQGPIHDNHDGDLV